MNYTFKIVIDENRTFSQKENDHIFDTMALLKDKMLRQKTLIESKSSNWDEAKRRVNEFEFVYSSSKRHFKLSNKKTISRAYFKLWEILRDFHTSIFSNINNRYTSCHIAEGPGGFIECLVDYKSKYGLNLTKIFGITLLMQSNNIENRVPFWKINKQDCEKHNIFLNKKSSNIGDLYQMHCINKFVDRVGYQSVDLITADGGFDFSVDFNKQEENFTRLFLSEICTALLLQKKHGTFIVKVFDMFTLDTVCLVSILYSLYSHVYIVKPFTSRPANSEKYLVCLDFKSHENFWGIIQDIKSCICSKSKIMSTSLSSHFNPKVYARIFLYNVYYSNRQITYLKKTLNEASSHEKKYSLSDNNEKLDKCLKWCAQYEIDTTTKTRS
jgi:23S rRNA U2552 (ribose-2'-O)-methylase RlmE/FtsJ